MKYVIIAPARNEVEFIRHTLDAVVSQQVRPREFMIVNDGSTDDTAVLIEQYTQKYSWIKSLDLPDHCSYRYGNGIISAFYSGLENIRCTDYDFIVKLDCDLSFDNHYFQFLLTEFSRNPQLGIASGQTYYLNRKAQLVWEDAPLDHTFGPAKMYRRECFQSIDGLIRSIGWDHVDEVMARMNGWETRSYPELVLIHHRIMGSRMGLLKGNIRHGYADYITGYHPVYILMKTFYRFFSPPYVIGALASFLGFIKAYFTGKKLVVDKEYVKYFRKEQLRKLTQQNFLGLYLKKYKFKNPDPVKRRKVNSCRSLMKPLEIKLFISFHKYAKKNFVSWRISFSTATGSLCQKLRALCNSLRSSP